MAKIGATAPQVQNVFFDPQLVESGGAKLGETES